MSENRLSKLIPRPPEHPPVERRDRARWKGAERFGVWIPLGLLLGFLVLLGLVFGERLLPARAVAVAPVIALRVDVEPSAASDPSPQEPLFQASGWIEPAPFPTKVPALVDGIVEAVHVLEGELVEAGQLLAELVDEDFRLDLATAESRLASLEAQAAAHHQMLAATASEMETLEQRILVEKAELEEFRDPARRLAELSRGNVSEAEVTQARLRVRTGAAEVAALVASREELLATRRQREALTKDFEARIREAKTEVDRRALALERTRITAPAAGRVLALHAVPGQKKRLGMDDPDSATIVELYDPAQLQARVDLPLDRAAGVETGQPVTVRSELLPDTSFPGEVVRIVGQADLQRNTLQVKVRLLETDPRLRPDMLCRAEFFPRVPAGDGSPAAGSAGVRTFVSERAVVEAGDESFVWVLGSGGERLERRPITLGSDTRENHRLVTAGLFPGDRVVLNPGSGFHAGLRVRPVETSGEALP